MKIGLALSGGGVLGVAHIGLLEELEKNNIRLSIISGTSSGAIIGALFAKGGTKKIHEFLEDLAKAGLFTRSKLLMKMHPDKVFEEIRSALKKHLGTQAFYDLNTKFACLATDITTGRRVVFEKGNLIDCIMASAAYPGVFSVQKIGENYYIDGGISRNLPVGTARRLGANFVIGSSLYNVSSLGKFDKDGNLKLNRLDVAVRSLDIIQKNLAELEERHCDFLFQPPVEDFSWYNFDKMSEILEIGRKNAREYIPGLQKKIKKTVNPSLWQIIFGSPDF